jgi:hypothetical protein
MIITACGGGGEDTAVADQEPEAVTTTGQVESATPTIPDDAGTTAPAETVVEEDDGVAEESFATVTIGDQTWDFSPTGFLTERCDTDFFGGYWVLFTTGVGILLPGPNWEAQGVDQTPNITVNLEDEDLEWVADPDTGLPGVEEGQSQIDSFEIDGNRASGTATFVEANAAYAGSVEPVTGTFEAVCAPEE